jgi:hypothetical protein
MVRMTAIFAAFLRRTDHFCPAFEVRRKTMKQTISTMTQVAVFNQGVQSGARSSPRCSLYC